MNLLGQSQRFSRRNKTHCAFWMQESTISLSNTLVIPGMPGTHIPESQKLSMTIGSSLLVGIVGELETSELTWVIWRNHWIQSMK